MNPGSVQSGAAAIVLAGGSGSRMGGADKPALVVGRQTMLSTALVAIDGVGRRIVVGPPRADLPVDVVCVQESPPGAGPLAAVAAGMKGLGDFSADAIVVMASDLPSITTDSVDRLLAELRTAPDDVEAVFARDGANRIQFLLAVWRKSALRARLASIRAEGGQEEGTAFRDLAMKTILPERFVTLYVAGTQDCDTEDDLEAARSSSEARDTSLTLAQARRAILDGIRPLPARLATLSENYGATLAEALRARVDLPRVDISAMDGYAVSGEGPWVLRSDIQFAGGTAAAPLESGHALRIATGASVPVGASAVLRDEDTEAADGIVTRRAGSPLRNDTRSRAEDWHAGDELAPSGVRVGAPVVSVATSGEVEFARVRGPVRAAVTLTGDEVVRDGPLRSGQTRDSVGPVIERFLTHCGIDTVGVEHASDTAASFDRFLSETGNCDLMVVIGATGTGAADQLRTVLSSAGARIVVRRVACRPGGSQLTAVLADGRVVLGLPGNPYAAVATLLTIAPTIVSALTAMTPIRARTGILDNAAQLSLPNSSRIVPVSQREDGGWFGHAPTGTAHLGALVGCGEVAVVHPNAENGDAVELISLPL